MKVIVLNSNSGQGVYPLLLLSPITNFLFPSSCTQFSLPNCQVLALVFLSSYAFALKNKWRKRDSISIICLLKGLYNRVSNAWILNIYKKVDEVWRAKNQIIFSNLSSFLTLCIHRRTSAMKTPAFHKKMEVKFELQT